MTASSKPQPRRSRYQRDRSQAPGVLSPRCLQVATHIAEFGVMTSQQVSSLLDLPMKTVNRLIRQLFDFGAITIVPVARMTLAPYREANDPTLLTGSAPNVLTMSPKGMKLLNETGILTEVLPIPAFTSSSSIHLRHRLCVGAIRLYFMQCARCGAVLERWKEAALAAITAEDSSNKALVRPDAWMVLRVGSKVLVACIEADRDSERGGMNGRWGAKITGYEGAFAKQRLQATTGYKNIRILIVTPSVSRSDALLMLLHKHASPALQQRIWITEQAALTRPDLALPVWRQPGSKLKKSLIPPQDMAELKETHR